MIKKTTTFYKYYAFNIFTLDALYNDTLFFSNPANFNDPFDCNPTLKCDSDISQLKLLLSKMIKKRVIREFKKSLKDFRVEEKKAHEFAAEHACSEAANTISYIEFMATDPDCSNYPESIESAHLTKAVEAELRNHYARGICCFSTTYLNPLLWSHYGDQHRGLCIGYSTNRLPKPILNKIVYGKSRIIKTSMLCKAFIENEHNDLDRDFLLRKAKDWIYEDEWRLIGNQGLQDSPLLFQDVTFGLCCPFSVMHSVVRALSGRKNVVHYYSIREAHNKYKLSRKELDRDEISALRPRTAISPSEEFGI